MRNRDTLLPMNERRYSVSYTIPIPTPTDIDSFDINDIGMRYREFRTKEEMLQFIDILQQGNAENVKILYYSGETYEKDGNHYAVKENVTEQYYQNPVVDFYIFEKDMYETYAVAETDATTKKYSNVSIKARTAEEACEIYFETRGRCEMRRGIEGI